MPKSTVMNSLPSKLAEPANDCGDQRHRLVGCLTSHSINTLYLGTIKPVSRRDQAGIPPEPLHHVTIIQLWTTTSTHGIRVPM